MPNRADTRLEGASVDIGTVAAVLAARPTTLAARVFRIALILGVAGMAGSFGGSTPASAGDVPASDVKVAADPVQQAEAQNLVAELKSAAKALNDIAARAPDLVKAMFNGGATVREVLALNAQSETAQARLEKAFSAVKAGKALRPETLQRIDELAAVARASGAPVKADTKTLEIIVKTTGALGGENFAVRQAPASKQKEGFESAQQAARAVEALTKVILDAAVFNSTSLTTGAIPVALPAGGAPSPPKRDLQAEAQAAALKAAAARKVADDTRAMAEAAQAKANGTKKDIDAIAAAAKRLKDQQGKIAKLKARIEATGTFAFWNKIALTKTLINELAAIPNQLTVLSKNPLATEDRGALSTTASKMNAHIRVMRSEMNGFIPDESKVRGAGATMEKMAPAIDKLVTGLFAKAAGEAGKSEALAEDAAARAKASNTVADELSIEVQKLEQEKIAPPELPKPNLVKTPARAANPAGRVPTFAVPGLTPQLPSQRSVLARGQADLDAKEPLAGSKEDARAATP